MSKLTNDFKSEFALLLVIMKVNYGATNALNYSKTLYEWALAALVTDGRVKLVWKEKDGRKYQVVEDKDTNKPIAEAFNNCREQYIQALEFLKYPSQGRKEYIQHNIFKLCFDIDTAIFPIALSEGILDLKDSVNKAMAGQAGLQVGIEQ